MIRTVFVVFCWACGIFLVMPWLILWSLLTGNQDFMYRWSMNAVRSGIRFTGVRIRVEGLENIPPGACIFVANHASYVDPLAFIPAIPRRVAIQMKRELFRIPILGTGMRLAKFVPVDRSSREGSAESFKRTIRYLNEGFSLAVYPEGTRSADGRMLPFKRGAFVIAIQTGAPIVPVSIAGAQKLLPKGDWIIRPGDVTLRFGQPIDSSQYAASRRSELLARAEAAVAANLPPEQQPLPPHADAPA